MNIVQKNKLRKLSHSLVKGSKGYKDKRKCRICGCTTLHACPGGCYWVADNLCSQCLKYV
ncbi:MAG: hypothetical protein ACRC76_11510 [Proteocatella sp.]